MSTEQGFEVASAYVSVTPNASDFADALDEQIGGISVSAVVTPAVADFAASLDEQIGGLSCQRPGHSRRLGLRRALSMSRSGGLTATVTIVPDVTGSADFGDAVSEQAGTLTVPVVAVPDVSDLGETQPRGRRDRRPRHRRPRRFRLRRRA